MVLASFLFIRRMSEVTNVRVVTGDLADDAKDSYDEDDDEVRRLDIPRGVEIYEINGPFFFGAAETFKDTLARVAGKPKVLIIRMRHVNMLDSTGMHALRDVVHRSSRDGTRVLLSDVQMQPLAALTGSPILQEIGENKVFQSLDEAIACARDLIDTGHTPLRSPRV
jgi:SulP family sulfate permease